MQKYEALKCNFLFRSLIYLLIISFSLNITGFEDQAYAQAVIGLPQPGTMVTMTPVFSPAIVKGINIHPDNPLRFDFIIDKGDSGLEDEEFKQESNKLIKYFLASLTVPEDQMWVNLSPYEKDRIIPNEFGQTEMGRDLLAQDYMLKQLTSSLMYPEDELGSNFWERVYSKAMEKFGTTDIPMNTFNKIWIVPETAQIYEHEKGAYIVENHLKVMLEEDYIALEANKNSTKHGLGDVKENELTIMTGITSKIVKEILIPEIEKEVNEGKIFAPLRQIYNSMLLASWYKTALKDSILGKAYVNKKIVGGVEVEDKDINQKIYEQYVQAFKKGVFSLVKEEYDPASQEIVPRKYFSGGVGLDKTEIVKKTIVSRREISAQSPEIVTWDANFSNKDFAMLGESSVPLAATESQTILSISEDEHIEGGIRVKTNMGHFLLKQTKDEYEKQSVSIVENNAGSQWAVFENGTVQQIYDSGKKPLPEPYLTSDTYLDTGWTHEEIPANAKKFVLEVIKKNHFSEEIQAVLWRLVEDIAEGAKIQPLPQDTKGNDLQYWNEVILKEVLEKQLTWDEVPQNIGMAYFYRLLLEYVNFFETGKDPFAPMKRASLQALLTIPDANVPFEKRNDLSKMMTDFQNAKNPLLFLFNLNVASNNYDPSNPIDPEAKQNYLVDDRQIVVDKLMTDEVRTIEMDTDNAGPEIVANLWLSVYLLQNNIVEKITLNVKDKPLLISDTTEEDIRFTIAEFMRFAKDARIQTLGKQLNDYLKEGKLIIESDQFSTSGLTYDHKPQHLRKRSDLIFVNGDWNYRLVTGNLRWGIDQRMSDVIRSDVPTVIMRTTKSETVVGADKRVVQAFDNEDPMWFRKGKGWFFQYAEPSQVLTWDANINGDNAMSGAEGFVDTGVLSPADIKKRIEELYTRGNIKEEKIVEELTLLLGHKDDGIKYSAARMIIEEVTPNQFKKNRQAALQILVPHVIRTTLYPRPSEKEVDLHTHTNRNDAEETVTAKMLHAFEQGLYVISITDHIALTPQEAIESLEIINQAIRAYNQEQGARENGRSLFEMKLVSGGEVGVLSEGSSFHFLTYFPMDRDVLSSQSVSVRDFMQFIQMLNDNNEKMAYDLIEKIRERFPKYEVSVDEVQSDNRSDSLIPSAVGDAIFVKYSRAQKALLEKWDIKVKKDVWRKFIVENNLYEYTPEFRKERDKMPFSRYVKLVDQIGGTFAIAHPNEMISKKPEVFKNTLDEIAQLIADKEISPDSFLGVSYYSHKLQQSGYQSYVNYLIDYYNGHHPVFKRFPIARLPESDNHGKYSEPAHPLGHFSQRLNYVGKEEAIVYAEKIISNINKVHQAIDEKTFGDIRRGINQWDSQTHEFNVIDVTQRMLSSEMSKYVDVASSVDSEKMKEVVIQKIGLLALAYYGKDIPEDILSAMPDSEQKGQVDFFNWDEAEGLIAQLMEVYGKSMSFLKKEKTRKAFLNKDDFVFFRIADALMRVELAAEGGRRNDYAMTAKFVSDKERSEAKVLVVDDSDGPRNGLAMAVKRLGFQSVVQARNGTEGLEKFEEGVFDLVITDLRMPQMKGDEMAGKIKAQSPKTPVILISGTIEEATGRDNFIATFEKPIDIAVFLSSVKEMFPNKDSAIKTKGGIDLNPAIVNMDVEKQGNGFVAPKIDEATFEGITIQGIVPVIINIQPIQNLPLLLGLADEEQEQEGQKDIFALKSEKKGVS